MKPCITCGEIKPLDAFFKNKNARSGRDPRCKICRRETARLCEQRYKAKDPNAYRAARARKARVARESIAGTLRNRIGPQLCRYLHRGKGGRSAFELLGYTVEDLRLHLESRFLPGMGWHNRDMWHIDHKRPLDSFEFSGPDDPAIREAWALSNLQPMWARDNIRKSNSWPGLAEAA